MSKREIELALEYRRHLLRGYKKNRGTYYYTHLVRFFDEFYNPGALLGQSSQKIFPDGTAAAATTLLLLAMMMMMVVVVLTADDEDYSPCSTPKCKSVVCRTFFGYDIIVTNEFETLIIATMVLELQHIVNAMNNNKYPPFAMRNTDMRKSIRTRAGHAWQHTYMHLFSMCGCAPEEDKKYLENCRCMYGADSY